MKKTTKATADTAEKTTMEKIGETVSHIKDVLVEQKDKLVEVVEHKAADLKVAIKNFKKRKKTPPKKVPAKKAPARKPVKVAKKVVKKAVKKTVKKVAKKVKPAPKKKK